MRTLLASLLILTATLNAGPASAGRWDQQQQHPSIADRGDRRPLMQRRQPEPLAPRQPAAQAPRFQPAPIQPAAPAAIERPRMQPADAARRAQQQYGGRVLSVSPSDSGYHVRLLREGEVSVVTVPN